MQPLGPIDVVPLFPDERASLLDALRTLTPEQWRHPTACAGWSVKDIAQHLIADDLGRLSHERDGDPAGRFEPTDRDTFEAELLEFINRQNEAWVQATRRLSAQLIIRLLEWTGAETQAYFETLDPHAPALGVSWAGEAVSANWFDLAREYTERWHHQAQIREGAGLPLLDEPRLFAPVLATFVRGVPHAFRSVDAMDGTHVRLAITGPAGGTWSLVRDGKAWRLVQPLDGAADASVEIPQDVAWRLFTKTMTPLEARKHVKSSDDENLCAQVLQTVSIIA